MNKTAKPNNPQVPPDALCRTIIASIYPLRSLEAIANRLCLWALTAMLLPLFLTSANAANWYVTPAGGGNGTAWNNAWGRTTINWSSVNPGDTIWLAGGTYSGGISFSKNGVAGSPITLKRATALNPECVNAAGWNSATMDQVATFFGTFNLINFSYITVDGNSNAAQPYGIKFDRNPAHGTWTGNANFAIGSRFGFSSRGLRFYRIEVEGRHQSAGTDAGVTTFDGFALAGADHIISHCCSRDDDTLIRLNGVSNCLIEYCRLANAVSGSAADHPDSLYCDGANGLTIRYCDIPDAIAESVFFDNGGATDIWIYGNRFYTGPNFYTGGWGGPAGQLVTFKDGYTWGVIHVLNNTFQSPSGASAVYQGSGMSSSSEIYNNALSGCTMWPNPAQKANNVSVSSSAFVNQSSGDYHLVAASPLRNAGRALTADGFINKDVDGNVRGSDGVWDVGAYEYGSGVLTNPAIAVSTSSLAFVVQAGKDVTNSFIVQNTGGGTLTGNVQGVAPPFYLLEGGAYNLQNNQIGTVKIRFSPQTNGSWNQVITNTGGGGAKVTLSGSAWVPLPGLSFESYAGAITAPFTTNGGYVSQSVDTGLLDGGRAVYGFNVTTAGSYVISVNVNAPDTSANSLFVNIDSDPTDPGMIWDVPITTGFSTQAVSWRGNGTADANQFVPNIFNLSAGIHQLIIVGREHDVQLGRITIAQATAKPPAPQNLRIASSP